MVVRLAVRPSSRIAVFPLDSLARSADDERMAVKQRATSASDDTVTYHGHVAVQRRGLVALPAALRKRLHLDEPGAQVEIVERADGVLELRPTLAVPATEAWFWEERHQAGEREVDAQVAAGETTVHASADDFMAHLDDLDAQ